VRDATTYDRAMSRLAAVDLTARLESKEYNTRLADAQRRFLALRLELGGQTNDGKIGPGLLIVMEGSDAGGKGGAIRRMVEPLDPRHFSVYSFAAPDQRELRHHFLWRFWGNVPGGGGLCVFDRSWYGRVLVERVEGYATPEQWGRAYDEIVQFERSLVTEGVILVKFWMQVSPEEQLKRFESRETDPLRQWKLTDEDWRNRDKRAEYDAAVEDMFKHTDHYLAPWDIIAGDQKKWARVAVLESVIARVEEGLARWKD
jgi:polyphosphate kinase 2 (PPK2 family)